MSSLLSATKIFGNCADGRMYVGTAPVERADIFHVITVISSRAVFSTAVFGASLATHTMAMANMLCSYDL